MEIFRSFQNIFQKFGQEFAFSGIATCKLLVCNSDQMKISRTSFLSLSTSYLQWTFQSSSRLQTIVKENSLAYVFLDTFESFWCSYFKTDCVLFVYYLHKYIIGSMLQSCVLNKKCLHQRKFLEIFGDEIISTKKPAIDSYSGSNIKYL